jgi:hypothetical protein
VDRREALAIAAEYVAGLRTRSYAELVEALVDRQEVREIVAASGVTYQLEAQSAWADRKRGHLHVMVAVDDGGWRAMAPLSGPGFIIAPDGSFVEEEERR